MGLLSGEGREAVGGEDLGLLVLEERAGSLARALGERIFGSHGLLGADALGLGVGLRRRTRDAGIRKAGGDGEVRARDEWG